MIINEKDWTRTREVCKALEHDAITSKTANIIRDHCNPEYHSKVSNEQCTFCMYTSEGKPSKNIEEKYATITLLADDL